MKQSLSMVFVLLVITTANPTYAAGVVQLPKTGQSVCYNSYAAVVACGGTGQDGELQPGKAWPSPRFLSNGDQTVTDLLTGLIWSQNANPAGTTKTWQGALDYIKTLNSQNYMSYNNWRLPNRKELMSLVNWGQYRSDNWLNTQGFNAVQSNMYWSGSTHTHPDGSYVSAWWVSMGAGDVGRGLKTGSDYVWPVRGGQYWTLNTLTIAPGSTNLGHRRVGITSGTQTLQIKNGGTTAVSLTGISFTGSGGSQFNIAPGGANPCPGLTPTLEAGTSCTLTVSASPTSSGTKSANLSFTTATTSQDIPYIIAAYSTVAGTITDQATGLPLSGATVTLHTGPVVTGPVVTVVTTDRNGKYDCGQLANGTYWITVSKAGYQTTSVNSLVVSATQSCIAAVNLPTVGALNLPAQTLSPADLNSAYSATVLVQGGTAPYTFSIVTGLLPSGLTINPSTGFISGTATVSGTANFTLRVSDSVSTIAQTSRSINVAGQLLVTTATLPAGEVAQSYNSAITTSGGSGTVTFSVNSGTLPVGLTLSSTGTFSGSPTTIGNYVFTVNAADAAGRSASKQYIINVIDTTGPTLTLSTLANGSITNNATLNINGTVSDPNGVTGVTVNAASVAINSGAFSNAATLQSGSNIITTVATDTLGNTTTDTRTITLDQTAPTLTVSAPADNSKTTLSSITLSGTINETSTVTVNVNSGTPQSATITGTTYSATANLATGLNTITITATDLATNTSSVVRSVTYDNTNPSLAITSPNQDITTALGSVTISGTVSDTITTAVVSITADGQTYTPVVALAGSFTQNIPLPTNKTYAVIATATDQAGNSTTVQRNIIKATPLTQPTISDGLKVLQTVFGITTLTASEQIRYDVAPFASNGTPLGNGIIDSADVIAILRRSIGIGTW